MKIIELDKVSDFQSLIEEIVQVLENGGIVLMPSDTCYGFLVDAHNDQAVQNLNALKKRKEDKMFSVSVADKEMLQQYVDLDEVGKEIVDIYLPGPLTLVSQIEDNEFTKRLSKKNDQNSIGVRLPEHNLMRKVAKGLGRAFCTTSANVSGEESPYGMESIVDQFGKDLKEIDLIIDAGVLDYNSPSTVIKVEDNRVEILREGELADEIRVNY